jgi:hypothetical protein
MDAKRYTTFPAPLADAKQKVTLYGWIAVSAARLTRRQHGPRTAQALTQRQMSSFAPCASATTAQCSGGSALDRLDMLGMATCWHREVQRIVGVVEGGPLIWHSSSHSDTSVEDKGR